MLNKLFIKNEFQKEWMDQLFQQKKAFQSRAKKTDEKAKFPRENIQTLIEMGYTKLTLPKEVGGAGISITDMVLFQETIASFDGATGLAIGWHQSVIGELYEKKLWGEEKLSTFAKEVCNGALVNRAEKIAQTALKELENK